MELLDAPAEDLPDPRARLLFTIQDTLSIANPRSVARLFTLERINGAGVKIIDIAVYIENMLELMQTGVELASMPALLNSDSLLSGILTLHVRISEKEPTKCMAIDSLNYVQIDLQDV